MKIISFFLIIIMFLWIIEIEEKQEELIEKVSQQEQIILNLRTTNEIVPVLEQILSPCMQDELKVLSEKLKQEYRRKECNLNLVNAQEE